MPRQEILDPQGKAILQGLKQLAFEGVQEVRAGKQIELVLEASDAATAERQAQQAAQVLLVNKIVETYTLVISPA